MRLRVFCIGERSFGSFANLGDPQFSSIFYRNFHEINHPAIKGVSPFNSLQGGAGAPPQMVGSESVRNVRNVVMKFVEDHPIGSI